MNRFIKAITEPSSVGHTHTQMQYLLIYCKAVDTFHNRLMNTIVNINVVLLSLITETKHAIDERSLPSFLRKRHIIVASQTKREAEERVGICSR